MLTALLHAQRALFSGGERKPRLPYFACLRVCLLCDAADALTAQALPTAPTAR